MTERFTYKYGKLFDNNYNTFYPIEDSEENIELFCNRLNKLNDENEQLRFDFKELKDLSYSLEDENKELKQDLQDYQNQVRAFFIENMYKFDIHLRDEITNQFGEKFQ